MTAKTLNVTALSPYITYTGGWETNVGGVVNGNLDVKPLPSRNLQNGPGTFTINGFMNGISVRGSQTGEGCSYAATIKSQRTKSSSSLPAPQTSPQDAGLLVAFKDLPFAPYSLSFEANCSPGAFLQLYQVEMSLWVGDTGQSITEESLDDTSPFITYSDNDWTYNTHLDAAFFNDTQHYAARDGSTASMTINGASTIIVYASIDSQHGLYQVTLSSPKTSSTTSGYNGLNSFLAVPVPIYVASGLDPSISHTITLEKNGGDYLDLDYIQVYKVGGGSPPGGELHAKSSNKAALIGGIVGGVVGLFLLLSLAIFLVRRRRTRVPTGYVPGVEKPKGGLLVTLGLKSQPLPQQSTPHLRLQRPDSSTPLPSPISARTPGSEFHPTPFYAPPSTGAPSTTGSINAATAGALNVPADPTSPQTDHPLSPHPALTLPPLIITTAFIPPSAAAPAPAAAMQSPVIARRISKMAELENARRLAAVGGGSGASGSSTASNVDPHEVPIPVTPTATATPRPRRTSDPLHDAHPVITHDDPPPEYDDVV